MPPVFGTKVAEGAVPEGHARTQSIVLSGLYAWAATVLYPASRSSASVLSRVAVGLALVSLVAGAVLGRHRAPAGRALSLYGFVGLTVLSWALLGPLVAVDHLEPTRAALGGFGWVLFAFSWGAPRRPTEVPEDDPRAVPGDPLAPRGKLPPLASWVLSLATAGAAVPLLLAWRITRASHALLGHAVAIVCAIALVSAGAEIAVGRGRWEPLDPPARRLGQALLPLILLSMVLLVGAVGLFSG